MSLVDLRCTLRTHTEEDLPLIYSSWCSQVRAMQPLSVLTPEEFRRLHRPVVDYCLQKHGAIVACNPDMDDHVYGYICAGKALHMIYVRNTFRQFGVGKRLMRAVFPEFLQDTIYHTHDTKAARHFRPRWNLKYDPYLIGD